MKFRSRFAPSPTGLLHVGNLRSALINWAYINKIGGEFILRIDDTDQNRSKKDFEYKIKEHLNWVGINWTNTFNQSDRINKYEEKIIELKRSKKIYPCFETTEELSLKRKTLLTSGLPPIYDRSSLNLNKNEIDELIKKGKKPHWRFKLNDEKIIWDDLIKGHIEFDSKNLSDPILIREDGSFLYHLPSVLDDIEENITHIIRGDDHISNTAFHIQIFNAFKSKIPKFGHHPFLLDENGKGFGKRIDSLSIKNLIDNNFENTTLINYLLTIGTSHNISKEKNVKNLILNFDIKNLASSSPKFSLDQLTKLNKDIIQSYDFSEVKDRFNQLNFTNIDQKFWKLIKYNINFFSDSFEWYKIINSNDVFIKDNNEYFNLAAKLLPKEPFNEYTWDEWTAAIKKNTEKKGKEIFMPLRIALTGKEKGPELKYLIPLLNRNMILKKLGFID